MRIVFAMALVAAGLVGCVTDDGYNDDEDGYNRAQLSRDGNGGRHCKLTADGTKECWQERAFKARGGTASSGNSHGY